MAATTHRPGEFPLGTTWEPLVLEWDRSLRAENKSPNTIRIYTLAASQLAVWMAQQPCPVSPHRRAAPSCPGFHRRGPRPHERGRCPHDLPVAPVFFAWLVIEEEVDRTPMDRTKAPVVPEKQVPIMPDDLTKDLLEQCAGRDLMSGHRDHSSVVRHRLPTGLDRRPNDR